MHMKNPRILELKDTKITIEIEAIRQPDEIVEENLKQLEASEEGVLFPYALVTRLKIGDRQIGLVQGLLMMLSANSARPHITLDLPNLPEATSPALKESLDLTIAQLKQFPFIHWSGYGQSGGKYLNWVGSRSVEDLVKQLVADLREEKDWHDRVMDAAENHDKNG
jgi:hypothetical protein